MQEVQIFVDSLGTFGTDTSPLYERLDLFDKEIVSLTSSIQNVKDIGSVFTDYTADFVVPASKNNNKIFKHYYNYNIDNGFEARIKAKASIKLNGVDFKKGLIRLVGVDMKNNAPFSYKLVFFGETVKMTTLLGDDELSNLTWLDKFNHDYDKSNVYSGIKTGLYHNGTSMVEGSQRDVVYPLISHTNILIYDSSAEGTPIADTKNLYSPSAVNGVDYTDLKPSIKLRHIITAIEDRYGISFNSPFFDSIIFTNLYMLLHRDKGGLYAGVGQKSVYQNYLLNTSYTNAKNSVSHRLTFNTVPVTTGSYKISVYDLNTNEKIDEQDDLSGNKQFVYLLESEFSKNRDWNIEFRVTTTDAASFPSVTINLLDEEIIVVDAVETIVNHNFTSGSLLMVSKIEIREQIPKMKVIDFLSSIFKMFNLTAYYENDEIIVKTLDDYYASGQEYDISKYIDVSTSEINRNLEYSTIDFKFEKPKTNLILSRQEILNDEYGNAYWNNGKLFDGGKYEISVGFEKVLYERITDAFTKKKTEALSGLLVDKNIKPVSTSPIIFYNINQIVDTLNNKIGFAGRDILSSYNRPSNSIYDGSRTINFDVEIDEWTLNVNYNSLFERYYRNYITNIFDIKSRVVKLNTYLPLSFLLKYKLNDTVVINGKKHKINSITTDLQSGKSELELINESVFVLDIEAPTIPTGLASSNEVDNQLTLTWNSSVDNVGVRGYQVYKDGFLYEDTTSTSAIIRGLVTSTTYAFKVRSYDNSGNYSAFTSDLSVLFSAGADLILPTTPTLNPLTQNIGNIALTWTSSSDASGISNYLIYRKIGAGTYSLYQTLGNVLNYNDTDVSNGNTYYYQIKSRDNAGNYSVLSNERSLVYVADTTAPTTPTGLNATEPSYLTVNLTWNASTDASGIKHYEIHRSKDSASYVLLNTSLTNSYTDTQVILDSFYCYKVKAVDNWDNVSGFSNIDCELINVL